MDRIRCEGYASCGHARELSCKNLLSADARPNPTFLGGLCLEIDLDIVGGLCLEIDLDIDCRAMITSVVGVVTRCVPLFRSFTGSTGLMWHFSTEVSSSCGSGPYIHGG